MEPGPICGKSTLMLSKAALLAVTLFAQNADCRHTSIDGKATAAFLPMLEGCGNCEAEAGIF